MRTCEVEGCDGRARTKGLCNSHYSKKRRDSQTGVCTVDGCGEKLDCRGLCHMHYSRVRNTGTTNPPVYGERRCSIDGCDRVHKGHGLCTLHWSRSRKAENKVIRSRCYAKDPDKARARSRNYWHSLTEEERVLFRERRKKYFDGLSDEKHTLHLKSAREQRENLNDRYVKRFFTEALGVKNPPQELIELKRVQLKIHRQLNERK